MMNSIRRKHDEKCTQRRVLLRLGVNQLPSAYREESRDLIDYGGDMFQKYIENAWYPWLALFCLCSTFQLVARKSKYLLDCAENDNRLLGIFKDISTMDKQNFDEAITYIWLDP